MEFEVSTVALVLRVLILFHELAFTNLINAIMQRMWPHSHTL